MPKSHVICMYTYKIALLNIAGAVLQLSDPSFHKINNLQTGRCLVIDNAWADPESFVREGPTLSTFSFS